MSVKGEGVAQTHEQEAKLGRLTALRILDLSDRGHHWILLTLGELSLLNLSRLAPCLPLSLFQILQVGNQHLPTDLLSSECGLCRQDSRL